MITCSDLRKAFSKEDVEPQNTFELYDDVTKHCNYIGSYYLDSPQEVAFTLLGLLFYNTRKITDKVMDLLSRIGSYAEFTYKDVNPAFDAKKLVREWEDLKSERDFMVIGACAICHDHKFTLRNLLGKPMTQKCLSWAAIYDVNKDFDRLELPRVLNDTVWQDVDTAMNLEDYAKSIYLLSLQEGDYLIYELCGKLVMAVSEKEEDI